MVGYFAVKLADGRDGSADVIDDAARAPQMISV